MDKRYPIGKYVVPKVIDQAQINAWLDEIEALPGQFQEKIEAANEEALNTVYREGGWTVKQVINHVADSHLNSFSRFKLALTEDNPTIRPYFEALWADTPDGKDAPVEWSLSILQGLHARWVYMMRNMQAEDWEKTFYHPEHKRNMRLDVACGMYAWHGKHHLGHINLVV